MRKTWMGRLCAPVLAAFILLGSGGPDIFSSDNDLAGADQGRLHQDRRPTPIS